MSRRVRFTRRAASDLETIAAQSVERWGTAQAEAYLRALDVRIADLAANPNLAPGRPDIAENCRAAVCGAHLIVVRATDETLDILAVPHQSMDLPTHMRRR